MLFWTDQISLPEVTEAEMVEAFGEKAIRDGWIAQLEINEQDFLHVMALRRPSGSLGYYLERRGPDPDEWYEGVTPKRSKVIMPRPWWQFWGKDIEAYLFEHEEMLEAFRQFLGGVANPSVAEWRAIPPSYKD